MCPELPTVLREFSPLTSLKVNEVQGSASGDQSVIVVSHNAVARTWEEKAQEAADWWRLRQSGQIQPVWFLVWFTRVNVHGFLAVHAFNGAAPLELALAFGHSFNAGGVVATPTAHDLAAVHAPGRLVAHPSGCTQRPWNKDGEVRNYVHSFFFHWKLFWWMLGL